MRKTKSEILAAVHETADGLHKAGAMDQVTLREFDRLCLPLVEPLGVAAEGSCGSTGLKSSLPRED